MSKIIISNLVLFVSAAGCLLGCSTDPQDADSNVGTDAGLDADTDTDSSSEVLDGDAFDASDGETSPDSGEADVEEDGDVLVPSNEALIFEVNPTTTPTPTKVELTGIADDMGGTLTSAPDHEGYRLLKAWSCIDEGFTLNAPGIGEQYVCTLRQIANKDLNGSFIYDDWTNDADCISDPDNIFAEVNAYYHVQKIYGLVTAPEVGVFDRLPGRHGVAGESLPLNIVANYRSPMPVSMGDGLAPAHVAFFLPSEHLEMGMSAFSGLPGLEGDVLVFGQGLQADFGFSGETIYHEFGHFVVNATAELGMVSSDDQGLTNLPRALDEGLANTFAFLGSEQSMLHQYLSSCLGGFNFDTENESCFPDDLRGHPVADGNAIIAANWEIYRSMLDDWGGSRHDFIRVLLETLLKLPRPLSGDAFSAYGTSFLESLEDDGWGESQIAVASAAFESRGLFDLERVIDISKWDGWDPWYVYVYGASTETWNTFLMLHQTGMGDVPVSTAYFQWMVNVPEGASAIELSARLDEAYGSMAPHGDWDYQLFIRHGERIHYELTGDRATATFDRSLSPTMTTDTMATWTIEDLPPGNAYLHLVNFGVSEGTLSQITTLVR